MFKNWLPRVLDRYRLNDTYMVVTCWDDIMTTDHLFVGSHFHSPINRNDPE